MNLVQSLEVSCFKLYFVSYSIALIEPKVSFCQELKAFCKPLLYLFITYLVLVVEWMNLFLQVYHF